MFIYFQFQHITIPMANTIINNILYEENGISKFDSEDNRIFTWLTSSETITFWEHVNFLSMGEEKVSDDLFFCDGIDADYMIYVMPVLAKISESVKRSFPRDLSKYEKIFSCAQLRVNNYEYRNRRLMWKAVKVLRPPNVCATTLYVHYPSFDMLFYIGDSYYRVGYLENPLAAYLWMYKRIRVSCRLAIIERMRDPTANDRDTCTLVLETRLLFRAFVNAMIRENADSVKFEELASSTFEHKWCYISADELLREVLISMDNTMSILLNDVYESYPATLNEMSYRTREIDLSDGFKRCAKTCSLIVSRTLYHAILKNEISNEMLKIIEFYFVKYVRQWNCIMATPFSFFVSAMCLEREIAYLLYQVTTHAYRRNISYTNENLLYKYITIWLKLRYIDIPHPRKSNNLYVPKILHLKFISNRIINDTIPYSKFQILEPLYYNSVTFTTDSFDEDSILAEITNYDEERSSSTSCTELIRINRNYIDKQWRRVKDSIELFNRNLKSDDVSLSLDETQALLDQVEERIVAIDIGSAEIKRDVEFLITRIFNIDINKYNILRYNIFSRRETSTVHPNAIIYDAWRIHGYQPEFHNKRILAEFLKSCETLYTY